MANARQSYVGFTIVELLIVIVVIGILAAIVVVSYNGITERARIAQQATDIDNLGKAIQLWSAENGMSLGESGSGYNGNGYGNLYSDSGAYTSPSLHELLVGSGYLNETSYHSYNILLAPCTDLSSTRWVVLASFDPAPEETVAEQMNDSGCTNSLITLYSGSSYNRNYAKVF